MTSAELEILTCSDTPLTAADWLAKVYRNRARNFQALIRANRYPGVRRMCADLDLCRQTVYLYSKGLRFISEATAREFEERLGLPFGALDREVV